MYGEILVLSSEDFMNCSYKENDQTQCTGEIDLKKTFPLNRCGSSLLKQCNEHFNINVHCTISSFLPLFV